MIANAVFCIAYRQNGKIRFTFDKPQTSSTALFTHRNKNHLVMLSAEDLRLTMS